MNDFHGRISKLVTGEPTPTEHRDDAIRELYADYTDTPEGRALRAEAAYAGLKLVNDRLIKLEQAEPAVSGRPSPTTLTPIVDRFRFRPATPATIPVFEEVRALFTNLAEELDELLPAGREKAVMFTELETAHFWANAAIARGSDQ